jgi:tetratricopeptide (TPR) repeat protein
MESPRIGTQNAVGGSSNPGAESDLADDFLREVAQVDELPPPPMEPLIGRAFGRFRVIAELGRGGMGIVYLAHDESLQRLVALKLLRPSLSRHDERQRRFLREARAAAAVTHPNLTTIYDVGEIDGRAFIAMERLDGTSLRRLLASGPLPIAEAVRIALSVLAGLEQAHRAGFVHRDLKPDNVFVTASGGVKLLDFGLAKRHRDGGLPSEGPLGAEAPGQRDTEAGQRLGTPAYMSPEQVRGAAVDPRADIFAFGVSFYEMLIGARPFAGQSAAEVESAILRDEPPPLGARRADIPPLLESVVGRCLRKDPAERYPTCDAISEDLARALGPHAAAEPGPPPTGVAERVRAARPHTLARLGAGVAVAGLALAGSAVLWQGEATPVGSPATTSPAVTAVSTATAAGPSALPTTPVPALVPVPVTELPLPASNSAEALAAYSAALQATRDGNWGYVTSLLQRAVSLDPALAVAHLRLALYYNYGGPLDGEARASFGRALLGRARLNERDQTMLEAFEPQFRDPPDPDAVVERLRAATARYPGDAEFHTALALKSHTARDSQAAAQRAVELDPQSADGWQMLGESSFRLGEAERGLRALDRCVALSPTAADCRAQRGSIHGHEGRCVEMDEDFRSALAGSRSLIWQDGRAAALFALGHPLEAVLEVYRAKWSQLPEDVRAVNELLDRSRLELAVGHFAEVERLSLLARSQLSADADVSNHARLALLLVESYTETGRIKDAGRIADDYLRRYAGWVGSAPFDSVAIRMHWAMLRANLLSRDGFIETRASWLREVESTASEVLRTEALALYARGVETESEAREALLLTPGLQSAPAEFGLLRRAALGQLYELTGRARDAIPELEKLARSCEALAGSVDYVRSSFFLGRAREATGDAAGACAAYGNVLSFWADATPPSRTAQRARARWRALACKETPKTTRTLEEP